MVIKCELCKKTICKYELDAVDFEYTINNKIKYICDDCAKYIANSLIENA